mgnify:CR=1 FL=1
MEKIIAFLLSLSMIFTSSGLSVSTLNSLDGTDIPVVHVVGTGDPIVRYNESGEKECLYPPQLEENFIEEKANEILPVFADAFFTQEWDEFCDELANFESVEEYFEYYNNVKDVIDTIESMDINEFLNEKTNKYLLLYIHGLLIILLYYSPSFQCEIFALFIILFIILQIL